MGFLLQRIIDDVVFFAGMGMAFGAVLLMKSQKKKFYSYENIPARFVAAAIVLVAVGLVLMWLFAPPGDY